MFKHILCCLGGAKIKSTVRPIVQKTKQELLEFRCFVQTAMFASHWFSTVCSIRHTPTKNIHPNTHRYQCEPVSPLPAFSRMHAGICHTSPLWPWPEGHDWNKRLESISGRVVSTCWCAFLFLTEQPKTSRWWETWRRSWTLETLWASLRYFARFPQSVFVIPCK